MLRLNLLPGSAARAVDYISRSFSISPRSARRTLLFAGTGLASYLLALVVTAPASLILPRSTGAIASGTVWNGAAALPGGDRLSWRWAPLRTLVQLGFSADWSLSGKRTELTGRALLRPSQVRLTRVQGSASALALTTMADGLPFACDMIMTVRMPEITLGGAGQRVIGSIRSRRGSCWTSGSTALATPVPALAFRADSDGAGGTTMSLTPVLNSGQDLATAALRPDGKLDLTITAAGAIALPFAAPPGGMTLQLEM